MKIVGGTYIELCADPYQQILMGSGLRGALALSNYDKDIELVSAVGIDELYNAKATCQAFGLSHNFSTYEKSIFFFYRHPLAKPVWNYDESSTPYSMPVVEGDCILMYGQLEACAQVIGNYVTYDPQNWKSFRSTNSVANHLALILNRNEAYLIAQCSRELPLEAVGKILMNEEGAEVIVIKDGANGAWIFDKDSIERVPAFKTRSVWPIGSGDIFSAVFAWQWSVEKQTPIKAAMLASQYTAHYCQNQSLPLPKVPESFSPLPFTQATKSIYLAGPFFTSAERGLINELRDVLFDFRNEVFSPMHDVGFGSSLQIAEKDLQGLDKSDVVLAVMNGNDPGTIFEVGYARAKGKKVIILWENYNPNDLTMFQGSGCEIVSDFATAVYAASW